jgi:hypothetical protein
MASTADNPFQQFPDQINAREAACRQVLASDNSVFIQSSPLVPNIAKTAGLVARLAREGGNKPADQRILEESGIIKPEKIPGLCSSLLDKRQIFRIPETA